MRQLIGHVALQEWISYKVTYNKIYKNIEEEKFRLNVFLRNLKIINRHNNLYKSGKVNFEMGINYLSDWTPSEVNLRLNGSRKNLMSSQDNNNDDDSDDGEINFNIKNLPNYKNWVEEGAVTGVKNQQDCGSCWAFATTGAIEGMHYRMTGQLVSLSEQQLLDCSRPFGPRGCNGGWMDDALRYVSKNGGISSEDNYPYQARVGKCHSGKNNVTVNIKSYKKLYLRTEEDLRSAVYFVGPIAATIDASRLSFRNYKSGVYYDAGCTQLINHAVLVVGYGTENGHDYWLVKNSWGTQWGDSGYIKMARNRNNHCGIATYGMWPTPHIE